MKHIIILTLILMVACSKKEPIPEVRRTDLAPIPQTNAAAAIPAEMPAGANPHQGGMGQQAPANAAPPALGSIPKAQNGTIAEIYKEKTSLKGKEVSVSGKVMKFTPMIMGRNWIHLQDGSGDQKQQNFDLTITLKQPVKVGDVVTLKGKLGLDKDIGSGYFFPVIIEDAVLVQ